MSAEEIRHEDAPKEIGEQVIPEERLPWMQMPESQDSFALTQERERDVGRFPEITFGATFEGDETRDRLLCAISETDVAKRIAPAVERQPHAPAGAEPPKTPFPTAGAEAQLSAKAVQTESAAGPARTFIVQTSPAGASMPLMPPAAAQPRHPAPPGPDGIIEKEKTRYESLHVINEAAHLGSDIPASNPQLRHFVQTSPQAASVPLMPPPTKSPRPRVSAIPKMVEAATWAAIPQVPSRPQPVAIVEPAAASTPSVVAPAQDLAVASTNLDWCSSGVNSLSAKLARAAKGMGRSLREIPVRFKSPLVAKGGGTMASADIAWSQPPSAPDAPAHAAQGAPEMGSAGRARSQLQDRLQEWFGPRRSARIAKPPAVAYCWTVDTPDPIQIADISSGGVHLLTDVRWPQGGMLSMTLQRTDRGSETPESWIVIDFMVIRLCEDGVAGAFIPSTSGVSRVIPSRAENCADDRALKRFVRHLAVRDSA